MKVTQEKLPASQIGLEIEISGNATTKAYEQVIQKFSRSANIPGFRKGKVPRQVILQRFGIASIKAAALEDLLDDTLKAAIAQEKIQALGNYQLRTGFDELIGRYQPGQALVFSASVDVQPEVTLKTYKGLQAQAEEIQPKLEAVDSTLEEYRARVATLVPVEDRGADWKDTAIVDFKGVLASSADGKAFPGGEATDFQVDMEPDRFIAGFIDGIIGMKPGETKDLNLTFPESYPQENLADQAVVFTITMKELKAKELPELDDDFAQEVSEFETLQELRQHLEKQYTEEAESKTRRNKEQAILNVLAQQLEGDLPESLVDRELSFMINQTAMQLSQQGLDVRRLFTEEMVASMKQGSRGEAVQRIRRTLAMGEIAKQESIELDEAELQVKVDELYAELGDDRSIDPARIREVVSEDLLKEKILDWLFENSTIELLPEGTLIPPVDIDPEDEFEAEVEPESAIEPVIDVEAAPVEPSDALQDGTAPTADSSNGDDSVEAPPKAKAKAKAKVAEKSASKAAEGGGEKAGSKDGAAKKTSAKKKSDEPSSADEEAEAEDAPAEKKPAKASAKAAVKKTTTAKKKSDS